MLQAPKITPFLWYNSQAEEAAKFYCSIFKKSRITHRDSMTVSFTLEGQRFVALNGGPMYAKFTMAVSFVVDCRDQKEVDYYWTRLGKGGKESRCGWLQDKYGLAWQIIPRALGETLGGKDKAGAQRALQAMMKMGKLDVKLLKKAYLGI